ncbi:MAG: DUF5615 family PIN-like protein [Isosphaeraceae bacterium]
MLRFHLDEHIDPAIADGLRRRGIDVTTTLEAGLRGAADEEHVAFARAQRRVIVTQDSDFLRIHRAGVPHEGIAFSQHGLRSLGQLLRALIGLNDRLNPEAMRDHVEFV